LHDDVSLKTPVPISSRIPSLDVLRGIAVLGGLFISIWIFGGFTNNQQIGLLLKSKGFDYRLFGTVDLLLDGKMRALIAIVFGAGMLLFLSKDSPKGVTPRSDLFIRRQMWLILFGIINAVLLFWTNDILFHLGVMGILLFPFTRLKAKGLFIAALVTTLFYCGKLYWKHADDKKAYDKYLVIEGLEKKWAKDSTDRAKNKTAALPLKKDTLTKQQKQDKAAWTGMTAALKFDPKKDEGENKAMRSTSYGKIYDHLLNRTQEREAQWTYTIGIWDLSCMIFLGMALYKRGFFTGRLGNRFYWAAAMAGIACGLLLGWFRIHYQQISLPDYGKYLSRHWLPYNFFFPLERALTAFGYACAVIALINSGRLKWAWNALSAVGRMSLTNYILQTLVCSLFFTGVGMGYFGRLSQVQLYFFVIECLVVQTVFSICWLRYFHQGPLEWLWRCLVNRKWTTNRIGKPETLESPLPLFS
jgi:uncharacterized protein